MVKNKFIFKCLPYFPLKYFFREYTPNIQVSRYSIPKSGQRDKQKKWWKHFAQPLNVLALINFNRSSIRRRSLSLSQSYIYFSKANFRDITQLKWRLTCFRLPFKWDNISLYKQIKNIITVKNKKQRKRKQLYKDLTKTKCFNNED